MKRVMWITLILFFIPTLAFSLVYIDIEAPSQEKLPIAISQFVGDPALDLKIREVLKKDLNYTGFFDVNAFLLVPDRWFKTESGKSCVLPLGAARELGIDPEKIKGAGPYPTVRIDGRDLEVINLFDEAKLEAYRDRKEKPITHNLDAIDLAPCPLHLQRTHVDPPAPDRPGRKRGKIRPQLMSLLLAIAIDNRHHQCLGHPRNK